MTYGRLAHNSKSEKQNGKIKRLLVTHFDIIDSQILRLMRLEVLVMLKEQNPCCMKQQLATALWLR